MKHLTCAAVALACAASAQAGGHTEDAPSFGPPEGFSLGVGVIADTGIYAGEGAAALAVPILRYESAAFSLGLPDGLRVTLWDNADLRFSALASPRINGLGDTDAAELAGIDREQITLDGGVLMEYGFGFGTQLNVQALTEVTGEHGGTEIELAVEQVLPLGQIPLFIAAGVTWQDAGLSEFLYGVKTSEALPDRPAYAPGDVTTPFLSIRTAVPITDRVAAIASVDAEFFPDDIIDSPIIDEEIGYSAVLGLTYRF